MREGKGCSEAAPASLRRMQMSKPISCIVELGKCMRESNPKNLSRRTFATALAGAGALAPLRAQAAPQNPPAAHKPRMPEEAPPFGETIAFKRKDMPARVEPFEMTEVRLLPGAFRRAQDANAAYLGRLDADRLLHNFRVNAGLPSSAQPLGGWEKPDCELRGHFVGHYLSACALMYSSTGDNKLKDKGAYIVAELAKCQRKLGDGYLSAFPTEFFDRLNRREKVWAPFYTIHKIMAGLLDTHQHCGNKQALEVLEGMANWADHWTAAIPEPHMQEILNTEYGGMNEVLYNLAAVTGNDYYAAVGDRFTKKWFFNPLALRRDELRGLHVNTHIPQVIGAARRYEISGDVRFHDVADFFWYEITSARMYVTGGTSNAELWRVEPRHLGKELKLSSNTNECCCAYNMLKLTRHLYRWTADPRYFDYYERTLYNHRLGTIDVENGATQYYLSIVPAAWRTFSKENDSFWCCTGTGTEEFAKLNSSIYFHDDDGLFVNLFIPSEANWREKGLKVRQETNFPESQSIVLVIDTSEPVHMPVHFRVPYWVGRGASVRVNGRPLEATPSPGSYLTIAKTWNNGDRVELDMPMHLHLEEMPDEPTTQAILYGPLVLAGKLGADGLTEEMTVNHEGPDVAHHPMNVPTFRAASGGPNSWLQPVSGETLTFQTKGQQRDVTFAPFNRVSEERYSIYWTVNGSA